MAFEGARAGRIGFVNSWFVAHTLHVSYTPSARNLIHCLLVAMLVDNEHAVLHYHTDASNYELDSCVRLEC